MLHLRTYTVHLSFITSCGFTAATTPPSAPEGEPPILSSLSLVDSPQRSSTLSCGRCTSGSLDGEDDEDGDNGSLTRARASAAAVAAKASRGDMSRMMPVSAASAGELTSASGGKKAPPSTSAGLMLVPRATSGDAPTDASLPLLDVGRSDKAPP